MQHLTIGGVVTLLQYAVGKKIVIYDRESMQFLIAKDIQEARETVGEVRFINSEVTPCLESTSEDTSYLLAYTEVTHGLLLPERKPIHFDDGELPPTIMAERALDERKTMRKRIFELTTPFVDGDAREPSETSPSLVLTDEEKQWLGKSLFK